MRFAASLFPLLVWIIWVAIITLFPFDFGTSHGRGFFEQPLSRQVDDIPLNMLLFIPLGAWLHKHGVAPLSLRLYRSDRRCRSWIARIVVRRVPAAVSAESLSVSRRHRRRTPSVQSSAFTFIADGRRHSPHSQRASARVRREDTWSFAWPSWL